MRLAWSVQSARNGQAAEARERRVAGLGLWARGAVMLSLRRLGARRLGAHAFKAQLLSPALYTRLTLFTPLPWLSPVIA